MGGAHSTESQESQELKKLIDIHYTSRLYINPNKALKGFIENYSPENINQVKIEGKTPAAYALLKYLFSWTEALLKIGANFGDKHDQCLTTCEKSSEYYINHMKHLEENRRYNDDFLKDKEFVKEVLRCIQSIVELEKENYDKSEDSVSAIGDGSLELNGDA
jgi:hypothetical protein